MFFKAAERSGKLQHLSRIFLTSVLIIAAVAAVFALCACVSDIGTAPISPAPTGNIGIETPDVEPTDIPYEISATYELYYFENRRLEQCVREQLFWEGKIFLGDILSVTKLDLSHCGINDISELAAFKNLVELDLSFNTVQSLEPLTQLKKLKRLTLNNVSASDFTFLSQLSQLCELSVRQCAITDLTPFSSAVSLQTLDISGNAVSDLSPISALSQLINLYADSNAISDLSPISNLSSLETLSLHGNDITAVGTLSSLTDLHYPPVLRRGVILQRVDAVGGLRAAGNGPDAHVLRRLADGLVRHGGCRSRFLLRSGGRGRLLFGGRIFGRFFRAGGNGHRLLPQCFLLGDGAGHEQPARNAYRAYAQRQNDVVALFAEKAPDPLLVRMIFVCLHDFAPPRLSMCQKPED